MEFAAGKSEKEMFCLFRIRHACYRDGILVGNYTNPVEGCMIKLVLGVRLYLEYILFVDCCLAGGGQSWWYADFRGDTAWENDRSERRRPAYRFCY